MKIEVTGLIYSKQSVLPDWVATKLLVTHDDGQQQEIFLPRKGSRLEIPEGPVAVIIESADSRLTIKPDDLVESTRKT